jgi:hypothetical protein
MNNRKMWRGGIVAALACAAVGLGAERMHAEHHSEDRPISQPAQCFATDAVFQLPTGIIQSNKGNLLVAESGTPIANSGRISIVDLAGNRRTLLAGLPSGISDVGTPNGPSGLAMMGRTLYIAIGTGDTGRNGALPNTSIPNPAGPPSSPILSSVLAMHFSANVEKTTTGFALTLDDHAALLSGRTVHLSDSTGGRITIDLVAKLPDYTANPLPAFPGNVDLTNPFALVAVGSERAPQLYVTDGGQNAVWQVDAATGAFWKLVVFPDIPNPLFPAVGGPFEEAVPTGIAYAGGRLLVTLFSGVPFAPGTSLVAAVELTGAHRPLLAGLKTAIGVLPIDDDNEKRDRDRDDDDTGYLVLQNASIGPFFNSPGVVLRFEVPDQPPSVVANCLARPTAMTLDDRSGILYVVDLAGHLVAIPGQR